MTGGTLDGCAAGIDTCKDIILVLYRLVCSMVFVSAHHFTTTEKQIRIAQLVC